MPDFDLLRKSHNCQCLREHNLPISTITLHRLKRVLCNRESHSYLIPGGASCSFSPTAFPWADRHVNGLMHGFARNLHCLVREWRIFNAQHDYHSHNSLCPCADPTRWQSPIPLVYAGIGVVGVVAALVPFSSQTKAERGLLTPGDALPPAVQA